MIPRPTLIEWQKRSRLDKSNWRVKHLEYLREQIEIESLTRDEIRQKPLHVKDIFLLSVFVFFHKKDENLLNLHKMKTPFRLFCLLQKEGVEYQHDFAKSIWSLEVKDGTKRKIADYYSTFELLDMLTSAQYALLIRTVIGFIEQIEEKIEPTHTNLLDGLTWQELHMYNKAFSQKAIYKYFSNLGLL